jgi:hypothetical protein
VNPRCKGLVLETPAAAVDQIMDGNAGASKILQTTLATLDLGNRAPAQAQMLEKLAYWDNMIGRGLYRGERTLFATQGGTKADAGEHDKNAEPDQEAIDNMIAEQINCQPARVGLTLRFGADILKKVRGIKPAPLVDRERVAARMTRWIRCCQPADRADGAPVHRRRQDVRYGGRGARREVERVHRQDAGG